MDGTRKARRDDQSRLLVHPKSAQVVLELLRRPDDSATDITKMIMTDPALSAAVLRAANSTHLGYSRRIGSIRQASVMLGETLVGSLAASRVADLVFDAEAPDYPDWLWLHSIAVGCACSVIARYVGESADEAFTVGLLHDVGWLLAASNGEALPHADTEHATSGAALLARWNLPDRIVAAVQQHHVKPALLTEPLDKLLLASHSIVAAMGVPSPERTVGITEALLLVHLGDMRQATLQAEIESELASLTKELASKQ